MALKNVADMLTIKGTGTVAFSAIEFQSIQTWSTLAHAHFAAANYYNNL
jgi:hypothetical protein